MTKIRPDTRDAIIEAGFQLLNQRPASTLEEIANLAGVGRATLHRHFSSRDALMKALAQTATRELDEAVEEAVTHALSHTQGLRLAMSAMIPLATRQWFLIHQHVEISDEVSTAHEKDMVELRESIEAAKQEGTFDPAIPTSWIIETYQSLIYSAWVMVRDGECTPKQASELAWRTLEQGLKAK